MLTLIVGITPICSFLIESKYISSSLLSSYQDQLFHHSRVLSHQFQQGEEGLHRQSHRSRQLLFFLIKAEQFLLSSFKSYWDQGFNLNPYYDLSFLHLERHPRFEEGSFSIDSKFAYFSFCMYKLNYQKFGIFIDFNKKISIFFLLFIINFYNLLFYYSQIYFNYKYFGRMRIRPNTVNEKLSTGEQIETIPISQMKKRVNAIKFRSSSKSMSMNLREDTQTLFVRDKPKKIAEEQSDQIGTNFWPEKPMVSRFTSINNKKTAKHANTLSTTGKIDFMGYRSRAYSQNNKKMRVLKSQQNSKFQQRRISVDANTYHKQLLYFKQLYDHLGAVLSAIQTGLQDVERAISDYGKYIAFKHMAFIDDFSQGKQQKIRRTIRISRIHQYLSVSYLFLEISQERMENNQSYLINFIGFCLSNLIYLARVYILLENRPEFQTNQFEKQVEIFEINSYGHALKRVDDVILRIQHNNQITTMIHKKLGRYNQKFENCIKMFLKNAERKKHSTCLCAHYIFEYLAMHIHESELIGISEFLQVAPTPYLAPPEHEYTLIIEPLGVLKENQYLRPYVTQFLKWAHKYFDIIMWTWQMPSEVEDLTEIIEPYLSGKLYRYHCVIKNQIFTKDLTRLGRNLDKTVIIDYDLRIFSQTPKNGIVCRWKRKAKKDKALLVISQIFQQMVSTSSNVEEMLIFYAEELDGIKGY